MYMKRRFVADNDEYDGDCGSSSSKVAGQG